MVLTGIHYSTCQTGYSLRHTKTGFYVKLVIFGLFIGLCVKIVTSCKRVKVFKEVLMYFNRHAFSVFMLHIPTLAG